MSTPSYYTESWRWLSQRNSWDGARFPYMTVLFYSEQPYLEFSVPDWLIYTASYMILQVPA